MTDRKPRQQIEIERNELYREIESLLKQGVRVLEIVRLTGKSEQYVYRVGNAVGHVFRRSGSKRASTLVNHLHINGGNLRGTLSRQSVEFLEWLIAETPEGASLADALVGIATDVFNEERGEEKAA